MGRLVSQCVARLHLAVQQAQGVAFQAFLAVVAESIMVAAVVVSQSLDVRRPAVAIPDVVDQQLDVAQAQAAHQLPRNFDDLGVNGGIGVSQGLHAELVVLPEAAGLGPFVAEHGAEVVHAHRLREVVHTMLEVGAADRGGAFGTEGDAVAAPVLEGVHLFLDDVRAFPDGPDEQVGVLKSGSVDTTVAEAVGDLHCFGLDVTPVFLLLGQVISGSAWRSKDQGCYSVGTRKLD